TSDHPFTRPASGIAREGRDGAGDSYTRPRQRTECLGESANVHRKRDIFLDNGVGAMNNSTFCPTLVP
ncbi:MAG: hypothetical protein LIQ30_10640, partial [Planctomycetes bacterium]|nr:hypothetical protein [Planctomycetota bacterium]